MKYQDRNTRPVRHHLYKLRVHGLHGRSALLARAYRRVNGVSPLLDCFTFYVLLGAVWMEVISHCRNRECSCAEYE